MYITPVLPNNNIDGALWSIYTPCNPSGESKLEEFFLELGSNMNAARTGMVAIFQQVTEKGIVSLPDAICHQLDKGIWELIKGRIRIVCFLDDGKVVICSHGFIKTTQKTPSAEIKKAKRCRTKYLAGR